MLNDQREAWCTTSRWDSADLRALFLNCTLKPAPELSHTQGLIDIATAILTKNGVATETIQPVDHASHRVSIPT